MWFSFVALDLSAAEDSLFMRGFWLIWSPWQRWLESCLGGSAPQSHTETNADIQMLLLHPKGVTHSPQLRIFMLPSACSMSLEGFGRGAVLSPASDTGHRTGLGTAGSLLQLWERQGGSPAKPSWLTGGFCSSAESRDTWSAWEGQRGDSYMSEFLSTALSALRHRVFTAPGALLCGCGWMGDRDGVGDSPGPLDASLLILFCPLLCVPRHVQWIQHQPQWPLPSCAASSSWHSFKAPSPRLCPVQPTPAPVAAGECQGRVCVWCQTCWACVWHDNGW